MSNLPQQPAQTWNVGAISTKGFDLSNQRRHMSFHKLYYHFVWGTKNRAPIILSEFEERLYAAMIAKIKELDGYIHALDGTADHVHLAAS